MAELEAALFPIVAKINEYLSNYILVFLLIGVGLWYSIQTRFRDSPARSFQTLHPISLNFTSCVKFGQTLHADCQE